MGEITSRQFNIFTDFPAVHDYMVEIYDPYWTNGVPAPFYEYFIHSFSYWADLTYTYLNRLWYEGNKIVGFVFTESPCKNIYFSLRPGYEVLADEMVAYADEHMKEIDEKLCFVFMGGQKDLINAATNIGYRQVYSEIDRGFDCDRNFTHKLPEGYHFIEPKDFDVKKITKCCFKGFDHEPEEGEWKGQYVESNRHLMNAPHETFEYAVAIADDKEEYVTWAGLWWVADNKLAYLEPLCTIPECRGKGLAAAALSEIYRKVKPLGAELFIGGSIDFYKNLGFEHEILWTYWEKESISD